MSNEENLNDTIYDYVMDNKKVKLVFQVQNQSFARITFDDLMFIEQKSEDLKYISDLRKIVEKFIEVSENENPNKILVKIYG